MQPVRADRVVDSRLRFFFRDAVLSFSLADNSTLEDVARTLRGLGPERYGNPVAIKVTLVGPSASFRSSVGRNLASLPL
jgi:hypothetical protein